MLWLDPDRAAPASDFQSCDLAVFGFFSHVEPPLMTQDFTPEQRVSIAIRLKDRSGQSSPQAAVQANAVSLTMTRLSVTQIPARVPVIVRSTS